MFYPGQPVYITKEQRIGIYVGHDQSTSKSTTKAPDLHVLVLRGTNGEESDVYLYELKELKAIITKDKKTLTGQSIYYGPFKKPSLSSVINKPEYDQNELNYLSELTQLSAKPWFKKEYKLVD